MRKYYCPYCGKPCITNDNKFVGRYNRRRRHCPECGMPLGRKRHPLFWILLTFFLIILVFLYSSHWSDVFAIFIAIAFSLCIITTHHLFSKITVKGDAGVPKSSCFRCKVEFTNRVKYPRLYFCSVSVVIAKTGDDRYPIRIEPDSVHKRSAVCRFYIINEGKKPDIAGKEIELYDNDRLIAKGFTVDQGLSPLTTTL